VLGAPELDPVANVASAVASVIAVRPPVRAAPVRVAAKLAAIRKTSRRHAFRGAAVHQPAVVRLTAV